MKPMYHTSGRVDVMIDLETKATTDDAVILSIGANIFNPRTGSKEILSPEGEYLCPTFYRVLHEETQIGRKINRDTEDWWNHPDRAEALKELQEYEGKVHLVDALSDLVKFLQEHKPAKVWACAPSFDIDILSHAIRTTRVKNLMKLKDDFPVKFYNEMDVRTIEKFIFGGRYRNSGDNRKGTYHNALDDCITQSLMITAAWDRIKPTFETTEEKTNESTTT